MATLLNVINSKNIYGKTTAVSLSTTSSTNILDNTSASSGYVYRIKSLIVCNSSTSAANITISYVSLNVPYPLVSTVSVPANSSFPIVDANNNIYIPNGTSLTATAGTSNALTVTCSYEQLIIDDTTTGPTLWLGGMNSNGQLGQEDLVNRSSPVQVGSGTNWSTISSSVASTGLKTDGTLWTWGNNANGQLGLGDTINRSSPVQVGALTNWSSVAGTGFNIFAVKTDGTLWTCGWNYFGQLGQNDTISRSSPVQVGALTDWLKAITQGAIKTDNTLWMWGPGASGRIGDSARLNRSSPVQVAGTWSWAESVYNTTAVKTDGTLWSWGSNTYGQLGLNDVVYRSSPVQIGALTNWSTSRNALTANYSPKAVKTDGTLWTWGRNNAGQLGQNNLILRSSPVQVGTDTNWSVVSNWHAIKTTGALWAIGGANSNGELVLNDTVARSSPVQVGSLTTWQFIGNGFTNSTTFSGIKTQL